jgi:hypothetical protein
MRLKEMVKTKTVPAFSCFVTPARGKQRRQKKPESIDWTGAF